MSSKLYRAFLFDMDGTLLNSAASAERVWGAWAARHGLDVAAFLPKMHGRRSTDTIRDTGLPGLDIEAEARSVTDAEIEDTDGTVEIPGARAFVGALPADRWAIVTSAPRALALARLKAANLPIPTTLVTAEDISAGKPDPEGYLMAARRLGVDANTCLVFEDALPGILAGEAAGAEVLVVGKAAYPSHPAASDYTALSVSVSEDGALQLARLQ